MVGIFMYLDYNAYFKYVSIEYELDCHKNVTEKFWKLLEFSQFLLIFVYILISTLDTTT